MYTAGKIVKTNACTTATNKCSRMKAAGKIAGKIASVHDSAG